MPSLSQSERTFLRRILPIFALLAALGLTAPRLAAQTGGPTPWAVPWLEGTTLSKKTIVIKRFGRLQRNEIWDDREQGDIKHLVSYILENLDPKTAHPSQVKEFTEMSAYAHFYNARLLGRNLVFNPPAEDQVPAKKTEILAAVTKAVELGFTNHQEILGAKGLYPVEDEKGFKDLVSRLENDAYETMKANDAKRADALFARFAAGDSGETWKPSLTTLDGQPFWPQDPAPIAVVVCRIHHDGLVKYLPTLNALREELDGKLSIGVLFYQQLDDDPARTQQSQDWKSKLEIELPCATIDRVKYRRLRKLLKSVFEAGQGKELDAARAAFQTAKAAYEKAKKAGDKTAKPPKPVKAAESFEIFQPVTVLFDASGKPILQANGVLRDWQLQYRAKKFLEMQKPLAPLTDPDN